jgi:LmbE family N-acetylglucosaminyl deacetylase
MSESSAAEAPLDLLAVGAHPDDVEIACGGTLAALARQGYRVGIVDLTDGEPTPRSPGPDVRLAEARRAAEILGVAVRETMNLPNRSLFDSFENRVALAKILRRLRPRIVLGFGGKTVMASPDHHQAMLITDAAVFYSRLTKWDEHFDGLPVHHVSAQLAFSIAFHTVDLLLPQTSGLVVADISETLTTKIDAVLAYQTQFGERAGIARMIESINRCQGQAAGYEAGEVFLSYYTPGTRDLVQWCLGQRGAERQTSSPRPER